MFCGNEFRANCAMSSGANTQSSMIHGCASTAPIIRGLDIAYAVPAIVTSMLANTSEYVRRTSVARSSPVRTSVPCCGMENLEKPISRAP